MYFFVDDHLHDHPKARKAGLPAIGLWTLSGSWCSDNLTDGWIPEHVARRWPKTPAELKRLSAQLVAAGLWEPSERDGEPGWIYHDWADVQPLREEVLARRQKRAEAGAKGGRRSGETRRQRSNDEANAEASAQAKPKQKRTQSSPVQSSPGLSGLDTSSSHQSDARENRDDDGPNDDQLTSWAEGYAPAGVSTLIEAAAFRRENAGRWHQLRNPRAAWRGWLAKAAERNRPTPTPDTPTCPVHPGQPTGSKACPRCAAENTPPPDLRALRGASA